MSYQKKGPFSNGVASPPIDASFLNALESFLTGVPTVVSSSINPITGMYHCDQYGAVGDGVTDDRAAIQAAVDAAATAYTATGAVQTVWLPPRVHAVGLVNYIQSDSSVYGAVSIMLRSGVRLRGTGTIKVPSGAYGTGAFYGVIRSINTGISNAGIYDITIDGTSGGNVGSAQCGNVLLEATDNIEVVGTRQLNANGPAILVRGTTSTAATNIRIDGNRIDTATGIGIQSSQFAGLAIRDNIVTNTVDNNIDVYGENGTSGAHAEQFVITGNICRNGLTGVFVETSQRGLVADNFVLGGSNTQSGIHVNRINGEPNRILITGNTVDYCAIGVYCTGDMGGVTVRGNAISNANTAGVQLGGGGGRVSYVYVLDNTIDGININQTPLVLIANNTPQAAYLIHRGSVTKNTSRSYDTVNYASSTVSCSFAAALSPGS